MRQSFKPCEVSRHDFAAPYCAVCSKSRAIGSDSDDRPTQPMLGQYTSNMGVVMLDSNFLWNDCVEGVFRRQVFGMYIITDSLRIDIEYPLIAPHPLSN